LTSLRQVKDNKIATGSTMSKKIRTALGAMVLAGPAFGGTIDSVGTYHGTLNGVGPGFFSGIGVGLDGVTCNGQSVVILPYSNPNYKDYLATLLAAQAGGQTVRMYRMADTITSFYNGAYAYCTITAVSLGDFPLW
jgi:hypothetical protein